MRWKAANRIEFLARKFCCWCLQIRLALTDNTNDDDDGTRDEQHEHIDCIDWNANKWIMFIVIKIGCGLGLSSFFVLLFTLLTFLVTRSYLFVRLPCDSSWETNGNQEASAHSSMKASTNILLNKLRRESYCFAHIIEIGSEIYEQNGKN